MFRPEMVINNHKEIKMNKRDLFITYMEEKFPNKYNYSLVGEVKNVKTVVKLICNGCDEILEKTVNGHMYSGCLNCYNKHRTEILRTYDFSDFETSIVEKYGNNRFLLDETTFKNYHTKTKIVCCVCGETYYKTPSALLGTSIIPCEKCELNRKQINFIEASEKLFNGIYDYSEVVYVGSKQKVKIWCKVCEKYFYQSPNQHLHGPKNGGGCPICSLNSRSEQQIIPVEEFISRSKLVHSDTFLYDDIEYFGMSTYAKITCRIHGNFKIDPHMHIANRRGCPICNCKSNWVKEIHRFLIDKNIKYTTEHTYDDCRLKFKLPFDFAIVDELNNVVGLVEYQGKQHSRMSDWSKDMNKNIEEYERLMKTDAIKREYTFRNEIPFLDIWHYEKDKLEKLSSFIWSLFYCNK